MAVSSKTPEEMGLDRLDPCMVVAREVKIEVSVVRPVRVCSIAMALSRCSGGSIVLHTIHRLVHNATIVVVEA